MPTVTKALITASLVVLAADISGNSSSAKAQSFPPPGKMLTMQMGTTPGSGTDAAGMLISKYLMKYLPNQPRIALQHMPGAGGITALNHVVLRTPSDGMLIIMGSASVLDPYNTRKDNVKYDPTKFRIIGGIGRGGSALVISEAAEKRLYDHSAPPAVMGTSGPIPRQGMQAVLWGAEYLGWNVKWVTGYPGTHDLMVALDRGEIDMTTTGNIFILADRLKSGAIKVINQAGMIKDGKSVGREDFGEVPLLTERLEGKIKDPLAQKAFAYWIAMNTADKWFALAPNTPDEIVEVYRQAWTKVIADPGFLQEGEKISESFFPVSHKEVENYIQALADTPNEAVEFTLSLMRKQGIAVAK
jgi:tripartite-type tricarboxylate transporter receptor subunit TctC